jgi:glutathione reductase (NADPH)
MDRGVHTSWWNLQQQLKAHEVVTAACSGIDELPRARNERSGGVQHDQPIDLVVIGTGTAASTVASSCRDAGWSVAVVDSRPFGGTCALRGCDPKRVLAGAGEVIDWSARMKGKGLRTDSLRIEWSELMRFKRSFTDPIPKQKEESFARAGISVFHGRARLTGPKIVQVGDSVLEARYIVVAAGARPATLHIPGENLLTISEQFLNLDVLPPRIAFVGGDTSPLSFPTLLPTLAPRSSCFIAEIFRFLALIRTS